MIHFNKELTVMITLNPIDFRCGHNKLRAIAKQIFDKDPRQSGIFIYKNKRSTDVKLLFYNGTGFFVGHQKLSKGRLQWWPRTKEEALAISAEQINRLLMGFDPRGSWHPNWGSVDGYPRFPEKSFQQGPSWDQGAPL